MNEIKIEGPRRGKGGHILLYIKDPADWPIAERLAGSAKSEVPGVFEYTLSPNNLQRIYTVFTGVKRPVLKGGSFFMDRERERLVNYNRAVAGIEKVLSASDYPVEPNGKFVPYAHQRKIVGVLDHNPYAGIFADCFHPDTEVFSENGYRKISEMRPGDAIETLQGPSTVLRTMSRPYAGQMILVDTRSSTAPIMVTPNHKFYTLRRSRCVIPSRANTLCSPQCNRKCPIKGKEPYSAYAIGLKTADELTLDDCLLFRQPESRRGDYPCRATRLITAIWLADGWMLKAPEEGRWYGIGIGLHSTKKDWQVGVLKECARQLGLTYKECRLSKARQNVVTVYIRDGKLANDILKWCGQLSHGKKLPPWISNLPKEDALEFIRALMVTDGCLNLKPPDPNYHQGRVSQSLRYTTVSRALAQGVRDVLLRCGIPCSVMVDKAKVDKSGVRHRVAYRLLINRKHLSTLGWRIAGTRSNLRQVEHSESGHAYTLIPIKSLSTCHYEGKVYNLTSAGHDSYLTDAGTSKNCGLGKTGSAGRAIELALAKGEIHRGKVLVSAPLSILETSWLDDLKKFTNLKAGLLWSKVSNKDLLGEAQVIHDYGPKPPDSVSVKKKRQTLFKNQKTGQMLSRLTALEKVNQADWVKYKADISYSYNLNGEATPFGSVTGFTTTKEATKANRVQEMLSDPAYDLFLINHDGVKNYADLLKAHEFAWVIIDESTKIKNPKSLVSQEHIDISWKSKRRTILTGTPNPNGMLDLWAQFYFLDRGLTLEGSMKDFLAEYFLPVKLGHFNGKDAVKWVIRSQEDKDRLITRVRRSGIFLKQRDCIDLPPRTDMRRVVRMVGKQEKAYLDMESELIAELRDPKNNVDVRAEAVNVLAKIMRLRQITSGYLVGADGNKAAFDVNPKLEDLDAFLDEMGDAKLVIACQFHEEINILMERYKDRGVARIDGSVPVAKRAESVRDFQNTDKVQIMVLQPAAAAHGITLTAASHLLFLSLDYNFEYYYQTAKRIERIGQKNNIFVIHSLAALSDGSPTIDADLLEILALKARDREALFTQEEQVNMAEVLAARVIKRSESRV